MKNIVSPLLTFRPTRTFDPSCTASLPHRNPKATMGTESDSPEVWRPSGALESGSDLHRAYLARLCSVLRLSQPLNALLPPNPLRPCFMPLAPMGFSLQRFPLAKSRGAFRRPLPS